MAIKEITDRLPEIEFDLITAKQRKNLLNIEKIGNVTIYRLGFGNVIMDKLLVPYWGAVKAFRLNRENHYAVFWCMMVTFASGAAYIANWFQKEVPIILTLQEGDSESWLRYRWGGLLDLSWRLALTRTNILTAISNYLLERARRLGYKGRAEIIPNGVDIKKFENAEIKTSRTGITTLITTSRLVKKNGVEDIIRSLELLPGNVHLKILGVGDLKTHLIAVTKKLHLEDRVKFEGFVDHNDMPPFLHHADIFIRPSLSEGMGNSFIEAMAAGLPVIATQVGGIVDFLRDGETGLFVEVNNSESIARQVKRLMDDETLRQRLIENGHKLAKERYDWDLIAGEMKSKVFDIL